MCARSRRSAFTLLELLVVLAIAAVLFALIAAAVQNARASASRLQCQNNLKQIGLALHQYHEVHQAFPPAFFSTHSGRYLSWMARILPYVEQEAIWRQAAEAYQITDWPWASPPHPDGALVGLFVCPDDLRAQNPASVTLFNSNPDSEHPGWITLPVAFTSYLGNAGIDLDSDDGVFAADAVTRLGDLTDGTGTTLLVGERPVSPDRTHGWWYAGPGQDFTGSADVVLGAEEINVIRSDCPEGPYAFGPGTADNPCDMFHYWSLHPGGANFLMADGSVRFLWYSSEPGLLSALATRAGGEVVSLD